MPKFSVSGSILIACNCDFGCPCNFNALPSKGFCEGGWCWTIDSGKVDGVDVSGLAISLWAKWPGAIHEGNGTAVGYVDERADDAQHAALARLLLGEVGGPWGIFMNTYRMDAPAPARFRIDALEHRTRLEVGDAVRLELMPISNPVTGAAVHPEVVLPEGLVVKRAALAASQHFSVADDDVAYDHSGQYTAFGRFEYAGD